METVINKLESELIKCESRKNFFERRLSLIDLPNSSKNFAEASLGLLNQEIFELKAAINILKAEKSKQLTKPDDSHD